MEIQGHCDDRFAEVGEEFGLDHWIGLPESEHHRVALLMPPPFPEPGEPMGRFVEQAMTEPASIPWLIMVNSGGYMFPGDWNSPAALRAAIPAAGGVTNARSLAGLYRAIVHDRRIGRFALEPEDIARMGAVQSAGGHDAVLSAPGRWTAT